MCFDRGMFPSDVYLSHIHHRYWSTRGYGPTKYKKFKSPRKTRSLRERLSVGPLTPGMAGGDSCDMQGSQTLNYLDKRTISKFFRCYPLLQIIENHKPVVSKIEFYYRGYLIGQIRRMRKLPMWRHSKCRALQKQSKIKAHCGGWCLTTVQTVASGGNHPSWRKLTIFP